MNLGTVVYILSNYFILFLKKNQKKLYNRGNKEEFFFLNDNLYLYK